MGIRTVGIGSDARRTKLDNAIPGPFCNEVDMHLLDTYSNFIIYGIGFAIRIKTLEN